MTVEGFIAKWAASEASERANKDSFLKELCGVLGVPEPDVVTGDADRDRYVFEKDATLVNEGKKNSVGKMDLYKHGCFVLEAKQGSNAGAKKVGSGRRGTAGWTVMMHHAFGQAVGYARVLDDPPPFLVVCDIGHCFDLYACFDGSRTWRPFPDAQHNRVFLSDLAAPANLALLEGIWSDPMALDPSRRSAKVTRDVAAHLAELARMFEAKHEPQVVAGFLMRCIFTMFAEDVGALPSRIFTETLKGRWLDQPARFQPEVENLWRVMNQGGIFGFEAKLLKFNGGLFADARALPIADRKVLQRLLDAAACDWSEVEPAIFGTLLERALDPKERHRLGAHYTPRAYVERLVRPTLEAPLRARWEAVRAEVLQRVGAVVSAEAPSAESAAAPKKRGAKKVLPNTAYGRTQVVKEVRVLVRAFHQELCAVRVLDPACGTGNFLYVALDAMKRLESEVVALDAQLAASVGIPTELAFEWGSMVTPAQFLGIEKKLWAKEIAELVLWIGFLQWYQRTRQNPDGSVRWEEPVLRNLHNIECRDAVLAWDREEPVLDGQGKPVTRWDGESMKKSPVTGEDVPDESKRVLVTRLVNPRRAEWPQADYVVGNPPFLGTRRMRLALGDGYVDALFHAMPDIPENTDLVMFWWEVAAGLLRRSSIKQFGFITTNSITQAFNRAIIARHLGADPPMSITFAIPDHPWVDGAEGAAVRVAMTVGSPGLTNGVRLTVLGEFATGVADDMAVVLSLPATGRISEDLRAGASPAAARPLQSNALFAYWGVKFYGDGFVVSPDAADALRASQGGRSVARPFVSGRDLTAVMRTQMALDADGLSEDELRTQYPATYQHLFDRVKPVRIHNPRALKRERWWIFGENQPGMRRAIKGLSRFIATTETATHRVFHFLSGETLPEGTVAAIASDDALHHGVLSSRIHVTWALAAGGTLENRPRYNKTVCFDPFPFPDATPEQAQRIRELAESLDAHRKARQAAHPALTMTGMYNVLAKLRAGEALTPKDQEIHAQGLVSVLKQLHDELDAAVFAAYGWDPALTDEEILAKVVALNAERADEESRGLIRWLRPSFQNPGGARAATQEAMDLGDEPDDAATAAAGVAAKAVGPWPKKPSEQFAAVRDLLATRPTAWSGAQVRAAFKGAPEDDVAEMMATLVVSGQAVAFATPDGPRWQRAG